MARRHNFTQGFTPLSDISSCKSFPREPRHPPELSLSDNVASHKATQNKAPSSSTAYSSTFESSLGSTLLLKPFLLRLEHLIPFNHFLHIQPLTSLDQMALSLPCLIFGCLHAADPIRHKNRSC